MSDAPETMILQPCAVYGWEIPDCVPHIGSWGVQYRRDDIPPTPEQIAADPRVQALLEALENIGHMGFDMPATLDLTDDQWRRRRTATMQMLARAALAAFKETGE